MTEFDDGCFHREEFSKFQIQKIYIRNLGFERSPTEWEDLLFHYFNRFGVIIDLKVLETSWLTSYQRTLRLRDL